MLGIPAQRCSGAQEASDFAGSVSLHFIDMHAFVIGMGAKRKKLRSFEKDVFMSELLAQAMQAASGG